MTTYRPSRALLTSVLLLAVSACSSRNTDLGSAPETNSNAGQGGAPSGNGSAGRGGALDIAPDDGGAVMTQHPTFDNCPGCVWTDCPAGSPTTVSGVVHTPAQTNADPLYNAVVYVPSTKVDAFAPGVTCDHCGNVSGKPVAAALSGTDGTFVLQGVPTGSNVPLVVQLGRWRRQVVIPELKACVDNPLPAELTRFPRNRSEGDIPAMALVTSPYDPEECILRKIGIDDAEFTAPSEAGRVHVYSGLGAELSSKAADGSTLWNDPTALAKHDLVLLPCGSTAEDVPYNQRTSNAVQRAARAAVAAYANAGGRVFTTDLSYTWITGNGSPFTATASWVPDPSIDDEYDPLHAFVDTGFPKGKALSAWLSGIGATTQPGELELSETYRRSLAVNAPTQRWLYSTEPASLQSFTFNTPLDTGADQQCGRVAYSSFHIAGAKMSDIDRAPVFPTECTDGPLTPQERVLEFLLFDLASCVQIDTQQPVPPEIVR